MEQTAEEKKIINNINNGLRQYCYYYITSVLQVNKLNKTQEMLINEFYYIKNCNALEVAKAFGDFVANIKNENN